MLLGWVNGDLSCAHLDDKKDLDNEKVSIQEINPKSHYFPVSVGQMQQQPACTAKLAINHFLHLPSFIWSAPRSSGHI